MFYMYIGALQMTMMMMMMMNLKYLHRVTGRIKAANICRYRSKGSPLRGQSLPKSGNFQPFGGRVPTPCTDWGEIWHGQADHSPLIIIIISA